MEWGGWDKQDRVELADTSRKQPGLGLGKQTAASHCWQAEMWVGPD